jgi:putative CocE/NonD family hydrolase
MRIIPLALLIVCVQGPLQGQQLDLSVPATASPAAIDSAMEELARAALGRFTGATPDAHLNTRFRLQMLAGEHRASLATLRELRALRRTGDPVFAEAEFSQYELLARARQRAASTRERALGNAVRAEFSAMDATMSDRVAHRVASSFVYDLPLGQQQFERSLARFRGVSRMSLDDAVALCRTYHVYRTYRDLLPIMPPLLAASEQRRYRIEQARVPLRDGNILSAIVVRPRRLTGPQPTVLEFTIYANEDNRAVALEAAANGFVGVVANTRGKRASRGPVVPWEHDAVDGNDLLTWISRQSWSNGAVGMIGGSYSGFTQWATAKHRHPALKTIVPAVAVAPGVDFPRENGIVLNFQYRWAHYVSNGPLLDNASYGDNARWARLDSTWFARGSAYRALDAIDGVPNSLFRRWLDHPEYDAYWQQMTPSATDFARLDIPVLSITGYFDGAQPGALHYFRQHHANRPGADHVLLIGPWDHFGAQRRPRAVLGSLRIDPVANVDIGAVIFAWMEHVLRGAPRPALLANAVNFQTIGTNEWRHASSLAAMSNDTITLHLSAQREGDDRRLRSAPDTSDPAGVLEVDITDRHTVSSTFISLDADTALDRSNALAFVGEPLSKPTTVSGAFDGELVARLNVRDADIGVVLYERTAAGTYIQLSYSLARASLAVDPTQRRLFEPGALSRIPLRGARIVSRTLAEGSRLVVVVNINKNAESQLNYGSGKDPSDETLGDASGPMRLVLHGESRVRIPVLTESGRSRR